MPNQEPAPMFGDVGRQPTHWNPRDRERREAERRSPAPATSALDQQVALEKALRDRFIFRLGESHTQAELLAKVAMEALSDPALLTTHRRQVLQEVVMHLHYQPALLRDWLMAQLAEPGQKKPALHPIFADILKGVASLRDTKENTV